MIVYLRNTIGFPAIYGFIPKGLPGQLTETQIDYQPEKARELVQAFVNETGITPSIRLATDINYLDICEYLQRELEKIGVNIQIELMPTPTLRQAKTSGKLEAFRASWIADYPDAENYLSLFYANNLSPNGPNYTHFQNKTFNRLYEQALATKHTEDRIAIYQTMDSLITTHYPIVPLYYDQAVRFVQKNVSNFEMNPLNLLQLKTVKKSNR